MAGLDFKPGQCDSKTWALNHWAVSPLWSHYICETETGPIFAHHRLHGICCQRNQIMKFGELGKVEPPHLRRYLPASLSSSLQIESMPAAESPHQGDGGNQPSTLRTWDAAVLMIRLDWIDGDRTTHDGGGAPHIRVQSRVLIWPLPGVWERQRRTVVPQIMVYSFPPQQADTQLWVSQNSIRGNIPLMECF